MSDEARAAYEEQAKNLFTEYEAKLGEFKETEDYKKFASTIKRLNKKPVKNAPGAPAKPASMPAKPPDAMKLFKETEAGAGKKGADLNKAFTELPAEEKEKLREQALEHFQQWEEKMKEWKSTDEAKKYLKDTKIFEKRQGDHRIRDLRRKLASAKQRYLKDEPKKCRAQRGSFGPGVSGKAPPGVSATPRAALLHQSTALLRREASRINSKALVADT
eukprot:Skav200869  [mRNA]  locus=scaffold3562:88759:91954:- [translate_table: standard]